MQAGPPALRGRQSQLRLAHPDKRYQWGLSTGSRSRKVQGSDQQGRWGKVMVLEPKAQEIQPRDWFNASSLFIPRVTVRRHRPAEHLPCFGTLLTTPNNRKMNPSCFTQLRLTPIPQVRAVQAARAHSPVPGAQHQLHASSRQRPHPSPPLEGSPRRRSQLHLRLAFIHQAASKNPLKATQGPL